jgi:ABC-type sugar transport system permease subunit
MQPKGRSAFIAAFLAPAVTLYCLFVIYPLVEAFAISLYRWRGVSAHKKFVGMENFQKLAHDTAFWTAAKNNIMLLAVGGFAIIAIAVAVAHALQQDKPSMRFLRGIVLFPQMVSLVAVAILWMFILNPEFGLLTGSLNALHLGRFAHTWLGEPKTALGSVGATFVWYSVGFSIMLFAAGIRAMPEEVGEAAQLDGAVGMTKFWKVTWPMLWSVKRVAIVNVMIGVMNVFTLVYLMTQGGPDRSTEVMLTYLYENAFKDSQFGYGTAIAVVNFVIVMLLSGLILFFTRKNPEVSRA